MFLVQNIEIYSRNFFSFHRKYFDNTRKWSQHQEFVKIFQEILRHCYHDLGKGFWNLPSSVSTEKERFLPENILEKERKHGSPTSVSLLSCISSHSCRNNFTCEWERESRISQKRVVNPSILQSSLHKSWLWVPVQLWIKRDPKVKGNIIMWFPNNSSWISKMVFISGIKKQMLTERKREDVTKKFMRSGSKVNSCSTFQSWDWSCTKGKGKVNRCHLCYSYSLQQEMITDSMVSAPKDEILCANISQRNQGNDRHAIPTLR